MEPLFSFSDHPSLDSEPITVIYALSNSLYWATPERLVKIEPDILRYTNMGEPYRELVRFDFKVEPTFVDDSIDITLEDAVLLLAYCKPRYAIAVHFDLLSKLQSTTPHNNE